MVKYFTSRLIYSQEPVKIKPESEISSHITLTSVISGLFHIKYSGPSLERPPYGYRLSGLSRGVVFRQGGDRKFYS